VTARRSLWATAVNQSPTMTLVSVDARDDVTDLSDDKDII